MFKKTLTEPKEHKSKDFIYLVHGILDWDGLGISADEMKKKIERVRDSNQFYRASMVAHLDSESAKRRINWQGEIYQMGTFGNMGLIVDPAHDGLVQIAWNCDLGSPWDPKELERYVEEHNGKIRYPITLLTQTRGYDSIKYNELILKGDGRTRIRGVFFRPLDSRTEREGRQLGEMVGEIMQTEVPVIELALPKVEEREEGIDQREEELKRTCENLQAQSEILRAHREFHQPESIKDFGHWGRTFTNKYDNLDFQDSAYL